MGDIRVVFVSEDVSASHANSPQKGSIETELEAQKGNGAGSPVQSRKIMTNRADVPN